MNELKVKLPDQNTPGYLKRLAEGEKHRKALLSGKADIDELIEYLLIFVIEPEDREEAISLLYELSFNQYKKLIDVINAPTENPTTPDRYETN